MKSFEFSRLGPAAEATVEVPPPAIKLADHVLVYDPIRRAMVYGTSPDYHQVGHTWWLDDAGFRPRTTTTHRVGSQRGPWRAVFDPTRQAIVAWGFDYKQVVGVVLGDQPGAPPTVLACTGDLPTIPGPGIEAWKQLVGVFGHDPRRGVTVCLTQTALHELTGTTWARVAEPPAGLPTEVDGDRSTTSEGAGAVWDAARGELVFWIHDKAVDRIVLHAWNGLDWRAVSTEGLPEAELCEDYSANGFAIGDHGEHGVVIWAGPELGLFGRTETGWRALGAGTNPPARGRGSQLAWDEARGALVLGPFETDEGNQNIVHELRGGRWRRLGVIKRKSSIGRLGSGRIYFAHHRGVLHGSGVYMHAIAWAPTGDGGDPPALWRDVVTEATADATRTANMQAMVTAWDGVLHAIGSDSSVAVLGDGQWIPRAAPSWQDPSWPLVAFDPGRGILVAWGPQKKNGDRQDETYLFDGTAWARAKQAKAPPADGDKDHDVFFDSGRGMVARLGRHELAHFDGVTWQTSPLVGGDALDTWRRAICHDPASGVTVIVNCGLKTVVRLDGTTITPVGAFTPPVPHATDDNVPFDHCWFDEATLALHVHNNIDEAESFALDLRPAFAT